MKAFVIARDRVSYASRCVARLAEIGLDVHIIDHGSTYEPMCRWLRDVAGAWLSASPHPGLGFSAAPRIHVHWRPNAHPRDLLTNGTLAGLVGEYERFVVTDCDVEPPADPGWLDHLDALLGLNPHVVKAGCGLVTNDLPDYFEHADRVRMWEANYQGFNTLRRDRASGLAWYDASVDTTLALYRRLGPFALDPSVRSADARFMARHLSWYEDSANLTEEQRHYREHAMPGVSNWLDPDNYTGTYGLGAHR